MSKMTGHNQNAPLPLSKIEATKQMLAQVLCDFSNPQTEAEKDEHFKMWMDHIEKTKDNPAAFFAGNGEGLKEYQAFTATNDRDKYLAKLRKKGIL